MEQFEVNYSELYDELLKMKVKLSDDPLQSGGPGKMQKDISSISEFMNRIQVIIAEVSVKLANLKSSIKNRKMMLKVLKNKEKYAGKYDTDSNVADIEIELSKLSTPTISSGERCFCRHRAIVDPTNPQIPVINIFI